MRARVSGLPARCFASTMRLIINKNPDQVAEWVATYVKKRILAWAPTAERPFVLGECALS